MSWQVRITEEADRDLRAIFEYIAFELLSVENASGQLARLQEEIKSLSEMPEWYHAYEVEPWYSRGTRYVSVDNYCVFYIPDRDTNTVTVLRVLYGASDLERRLIQDDTFFSEQN